MRKTFWRVAFVLLGLLLLPTFASRVSAQEDRPLLNLLGNVLEDGLNEAARALENPPPPAPAPVEMTPDLAYRLLVAGNARYTKNDTQDADALAPPAVDPNAFPIATVFFSPESRTTPDYVFDISPEHLDLVPVRAGVFTSDELDDLEYGIVNLRTPLVVVLTHAPSREIERLLSVWSTLDAEAKSQVASTGTFFTGGDNTPPQSDDERLYSLAGPAVARAMSAYPNASASQLERIIAEGIAWQSIEAMLMQSAALRQLVAGGQTNLVAAVLDETTGEIEWLGRHPLTEEFLQTVPQNVVTQYGSGEVAESDLPPALDSAQVEKYLSDDVANTYYVNVTNDYYYRPAPSVPSWNLFRPDIWEYRPWFGVWVRPFAPLPKYHPWLYGPARHYPYWTPGHPNFFIGFNWGLDYHHIPPDFRPHDPRWDKPFFLDPTRHPGWIPGSPWDDIWHRGPHPDWHPGPNGYHGPVGPDGPPHDGWHPGDDHPGWGHQDGNPHHNDPWHHDDDPDGRRDHPGNRGGDGQPGGEDRPGGHGGDGQPGGEDRPGGHGGDGQPGGQDQPGGHGGDGQPGGQDQPGGDGGDRNVWGVNRGPRTPSHSEPQDSNPLSFMHHRVPQSERPNQPQTVPRFGGFRPAENQHETPRVTPHNSGGVRPAQTQHETPRVTPHNSGGVRPAQTQHESPRVTPRNSGGVRPAQTQHATPHISGGVRPAENQHDTPSVSPLNRLPGGKNGLRHPGR